MHKFAVTGGAGFIGSHLSEALVGSGYHVKVIDHLSSGKLENLKNITSKIELLKIDVRDYSKLRSTLSDVEGVFHLGNLNLISESFKKEKEYYEVNVQGTKNVLELAKEYGFKVVFASSSNVYGDNAPNEPIKEDFPTNPTNPYGTTKKKAEELCKSYLEAGRAVVCLRYFNVFGTRQQKGAVYNFLKNVRQGRPPVIYGDGMQTRDFVYVGDVVNATIKAMQTKVNNLCFNVGSGMSYSILDVANLVLKSRKQTKLKPLFIEPEPGQPRYCIANIELARNVLGFTPKVSLEEWLSTDESSEV